MEAMPDRGKGGSDMKINSPNTNATNNINKWVLSFSVASLIWGRKYQNWCGARGFVLLASNP